MKSGLYNPGNAMVAEPLAYKPKVLLVENEYAPGRCWQLLGRRVGRRLHDHPYGSLRTASGVVVKAHRWAWAAVNGEIPAGVHISYLSGGRDSGRGVVRSMSRVEETPITARLPVPDVEKLEKLAAESDRSRSAEVRRAVREYVERHTEEGAGVATG